MQQYFKRIRFKSFIHIINTQYTNYRKLNIFQNKNDTSDN